MRRLALVLLPEFSNLGLAAVTEPLFVANWLAQRTLFEWKSVSVDGKPVRASNGAILAVDGDLAAARDCASIFVLASFEPLQSARSRPLTRWLQRAARVRRGVGRHRKWQPGAGGGGSARQSSGRHSLGQPGRLSGVVSQSPDHSHPLFAHQEPPHLRGRRRHSGHDDRLDRAACGRASRRGGGAASATQPRTQTPRRASVTLSSTRPVL